MGPKSINYIIKLKRGNFYLLSHSYEIRPFIIAWGGGGGGGGGIWQQVKISAQYLQNYASLAKKKQEHRYE